MYVGSCVSDMYFVVEAGVGGTFNFFANYLEGACDPVVENDYTYCGALTYQNCDRCNSKCRLAECKSKDNAVVADLCLPSHVSMAEIEERCYAVMGSETYDWKSECSSSEADSSSIGTVLLICFFGVTFLAFVGSVGWYHWRLRKTGQVPLTCPGFCPHALFPPQPEVKPPPRSSSYSPPEFYSD